jgi:hypothetical protein
MTDKTNKTDDKLTGWDVFSALWSVIQALAFFGHH